MKKTIALLVIFLFTGLVVIANPFVNATTTTIITTTTLQEDTAAFTYQDNIYYFNDYEDLISQIYEDVHDDLYQTIYDSVMAEIDEEFYEEIYSQVESQLLDLLSENEISVYLEEFQNQIYEVNALAENCVFGVSIYTPDSGNVIGSGVVYDYDDVEEQYYLITNHHVIKDYLAYLTAHPTQSERASIDIVFSDGTEIGAYVVGYDTEVDVAILKFSAVGLPQTVTVAEFAEDTEPQVSDIVLAVGNPLGFDYFGSITMGVISGLDRKIDKDRYVDYVQHDAAINSGNSGGPVFNLDGEIVGINVSKLADIEIEGMGFAIPVDIIKRIIERIEDDDWDYDTIMPRMRFDFEEIAELVDDGEIFLDSFYVRNETWENITLTLPSGLTNGFFVTEIDNYTTLDGYFTNGDILVSVGGHQLTNSDDFYTYLYENYESGDSVTIQYYDFNETIFEYTSSLATVTVVLI